MSATTCMGSPPVLGVRSWADIIEAYRPVVESKSSWARTRRPTVSLCISAFQSKRHLKTTVRGMSGRPAVSEGYGFVGRVTGSRRLHRCPSHSRVVSDRQRIGDAAYPQRHVSNAHRRRQSMKTIRDAIHPPAGSVVITRLRRLSDRFVSAVPHHFRGRSGTQGDR
jgi:hypothetical protein